SPGETRAQYPVWIRINPRRQFADNRRRGGQAEARCSDCPRDLGDMNPTDQPYRDSTLHEVLRLGAFKQPDRVAIVFNERLLTFADLETESNRLAHGLNAIGIEPGDRIGLFTLNCPEFEIAFYAISKAGGIACPLNASYREREVAYQLNDAGAKV